MTPPTALFSKSDDRSIEINDFSLSKMPALELIWTAVSLHLFFVIEIWLLRQKTRRTFLKRRAPNIRDRYATNCEPKLLGYKKDIISPAARIVRWGIVT